MKDKFAFIAASLVILGGSAAFAQGLPPTNMGKFVHQPGDNQYSSSTQRERHGNTYADRTGPGGPVYMGGGGGGAAARPVPGMAPMVVNPMILMGGNKPRVDISLEPIAADEPIPEPGFPPLPERMQLPIANAPGGSSPSWNSNGGGGGGGGGGRSRGPQVEGVHQHYAHLKPGAYMDRGGGGGGGDASGGGGGGGDEAVPGASEGSAIGGMGAGPRVHNNATGGVGYYKARTPPPPTVERPGAISGGSGSDTFNANTAVAPRYRGASSRDLKALGKAPDLDGKQDAVGAPEAPQAAIVTQSTTQDLSLPDDEFVSRYGLQDTKGKKFGRFVGKTVTRATNRAVNRATSLVGF